MSVLAQEHEVGEYLDSAARLLVDLVQIKLVIRGRLAVQVLCLVALLEYVRVVGRLLLGEDVDLPGVEVYLLKQARPAESVLSR